MDAESLTLINAIAAPFLWTLFLVVLRLAPTVMLVPALGGMRIPQLVRVGIVFILASAMMPATPEPAPTSLLDATPAIASQLLFGLLVGIVTSAVFEAMRMAGSLADVSLGRGSFGAVDPLGGGGPAGTFSLFYSLFFLAVFTALAGHTIIVRAIHDSWTWFGPGEVLTGNSMGAVAEVTVDMTGAAIAAAVAIALPAFVAAALVDFSLGWLNRSMPSLPSMFLAMPLRALVGWLIVAATLLAAATWMFDELLISIDRLREVFAQP